MDDPLRIQLQSDLNEARKGRNRLRTLVLSTTLSDVRNREIELGRDLDRGELVEVVSRAVKRRREAAEQMRRGGRADLAEKEEAEAEILSRYLPAGLSEEEVRAMVREILGDGVTELGPLMGRLMPRLKGRFDGREANRIVREELGR